MSPVRKSAKTSARGAAKKPSKVASRLGSGAENATAKVASMNPSEALRQLNMFIRDHSLMPEPMSADAKALVEALIARASKAEPWDIGSIMVELKEIDAAKKTVPDQRRSKILSFLDSLTDSHLVAIGRYKMDMVLSEAAVRIRAPPQWYPLNDL